MDLMITSRYGLKPCATGNFLANHSYKTQEKVPPTIAGLNVLTGSLGSADVEGFAGRSPPASNSVHTRADGPVQHASLPHSLLHTSTSGPSPA